MMRSKAKHSGFTVAEMLVALVISAMLLAAVAVALHAWLFSYEQNEQLAAVTQTARAVLNRMTREIRTAQAIDYSGGLLTILPPDDGSGISQMKYENTGSELIYSVTKDGDESSYDLVADTDDVQVSSFSITQETGQDSEGYDCCKSLTIQIVLQVDGKEMPYTATARPRRNQIY